MGLPSFPFSSVAIKTTPTGCHVRARSHRFASVPWRPVPVVPSSSSSQWRTSATRPPH